MKKIIIITGSLAIIMGLGACLHTGLCAQEKSYWETIKEQAQKAYDYIESHPAVKGARQTVTKSTQATLEELNRMTGLDIGAYATTGALAGSVFGGPIGAAYGAAAWPTLVAFANSLTGEALKDPNLTEEQAQEVIEQAQTVLEEADTLKKQETHTN